MRKDFRYMFTVLLVFAIIMANGGMMKSAKAEDMTINGTSTLTAQQLGDYVLMNNPSPKLSPGTSIYQLAEYYLQIGNLEGIKGDVAFAQAIHETGFFNFGGDVIPEQNNYAGIGTTGGGVKGAFFATPEEGVRAHIQHLKAYSSTLPLATELADPRFYLVNRGVANYWADLNGKWAVPGKGYGERVQSIYDSIGKVTLTIPNTMLPSGHSLPVGKLTIKKDTEMLAPDGTIYKMLKNGSTFRVFGVRGNGYDLGGGYTVKAESSTMSIYIGRILIKNSDTYMYGPFGKISRKVMPGEALRVYSYDDSNYYVGGGYYVPKIMRPVYFLGYIKLAAQTDLYNPQGDPIKTLVKGNLYRVFNIKGRNLDLGGGNTITLDKSTMEYIN
ncbi:glucosaminidase domain-containing protein [Metabacillus sp. RGM 3146]|uniref:glucosaminidase domain-containing protein n=1 Tax=Metabacillus sp. RGM 3146 TaxID=3401092 RepID=UPI003B9A64AA